MIYRVFINTGKEMYRNDLAYLQLPYSQFQSGTFYQNGVQVKSCRIDSVDSTSSSVLYDKAVAVWAIQVSGQGSIELEFDTSAASEKYRIAFIQDGNNYSGVYLAPYGCPGTALTDSILNQVSTHSIFSGSTATNPKIGAAIFDGSYIWLIPYNTTTLPNLYKLDITGGDPISVPTSGCSWSSCTCAAYDGHYIWLYSDNKLYKVDISLGSAEFVSSITLYTGVTDAESKVQYPRIYGLTYAFGKIFPATWYTFYKYTTTAKRIMVGMVVVDAETNDVYHPEAFSHTTTAANKHTLVYYRSIVFNGLSVTPITFRYGRETSTNNYTTHIVSHKYTGFFPRVNKVQSTGAAPLMVRDPTVFPADYTNYGVGDIRSSYLSYFGPNEEKTDYPNYSGVYYSAGSFFHYYTSGAVCLKQEPGQRASHAMIVNHNTQVEAGSSYLSFSFAMNTKNNQYTASWYGSTSLIDPEGNAFDVTDTPAKMVSDGCNAFTLPGSHYCTQQNFPAVETTPSSYGRFSRKTQTQFTTTSIPFFASAGTLAGLWRHSLSAVIWTPYGIFCIPGVQYPTKLNLTSHIIDYNPTNYYEYFALKYPELCNIIAVRGRCNDDVLYHTQVSGRMGNNPAFSL